MDILFWTGAFILFVAVEAFTFELVSLWFAVGALAAFLAALAGAGIPVQTVLFLAFSLISLLVFRPLLKKYMKKGTAKTNADSLIGETALITAGITENSFGKAVVRGQEWTAAAKNPGEEFVPGDQVIVTAIDGVKLMVRRKAERKPNNEPERETD